MIRHGILVTSCYIKLHRTLRHAHRVVALTEWTQASFYRSGEKVPEIVNSVDKKTSQFKSRLNFQACKSIGPLTRLAHLRNLCLYCQSSCDVGQRSCQVCKTSRMISGVISLSLVFFCLCHLCVFFILFQSVDQLEMLHFRHLPTAALATL